MVKKKKGKHRATTDVADIMDEMVAIEAIYGSAYTPNENQRGFSISVKPQSGDHHSADMSVLLEFGWATYQNTHVYQLLWCKSYLI